MAKGRLKDAVKKATESLKKRASNAGKALKESKNRRTIDAVEVVGGGVTAGAIHGAGLSFQMGDTEVPIGAAVGIGGVIAGVVMKQPDVQALALGAAAYGLGRLAEDVVSDAFDDDTPE